MTAVCRCPICTPHALAAGLTWCSRSPPDRQPTGADGSNQPNQSFLEVDLSAPISKFEQQKHQAQSSQFVFELSPQTLLTIDLAAPVIGKTPSTFRCDVTRRPQSLPHLTRIGGRIFVRVDDLLSFINPLQPRQADRLEPLRRGRRRKAIDIEDGLTDNERGSK